MPLPLSVKSTLIELLDKNSVFDDDVTLYSYRCDGLTVHPNVPMGVIFPQTIEQVVGVVKLLNEHKIHFLPRGAGTGLSGGAIPVGDCVIIEMFRFRSLHNIDPINRTIAVGAGMVNIRISDAVKHLGFHFVPDPSSQKACSVGGNVGENAGGPHTLKYGVTVNHILGLTAVLADGTVVTFGGTAYNSIGPDILGLFVGSEGTFGIVTEVICRLTPVPEKTVTLLATFSSIDDACHAVSNIIAAGIVPAALEMLDNLVIQALEKSSRPGFPLDADALIIIELEDLADALPEEKESILKILDDNHATQIREAKDEAERGKIWSARKGAFGAIGTLSPNFYTQDGVVPRAALPEIFRSMRHLSAEHGLKIANVFHAGDGNLHPLILFDSRNPNETETAQILGEKILEKCLELGGSLTGEHGIGLEKNNMMPRLFNADDLENFRTIKTAFNPDDLLNPGKILPTPGKCSEMRFMGAKSGLAA